MSQDHKGRKWTPRDRSDMNSTRDDSRFDEWLTKINQHSFDSLKSNSLQVAGEEARTSNKKSRSMQDQEASLRRLAENHEAEERSALRRKKRAELAKMRGNGKHGTIVVDRSRPRVIRLTGRHGNNVKEGNENESKVDDDLDPHRDRKRRRVHDTSQRDKHSYGNLLDSHRYGENKRGPIVLSCNPQGFFGKGVSSGQHVSHDKRLPIQGPKETANLSAGARVVSEASLVRNSSDEDESSLNKVSATKEALIVWEHVLKRTIKRMKKSRKRTSKQECSHVVEKQRISSDNSDNHSAYSRAQRVDSKSSIPLKDVPPLESLGHLRMASEASQDQRLKLAKPANTSSEANHEAPPPLLAFNGNKPYQHHNAWRGQHDRGEQEWREMKERLEESGGPDLRSGKPLEYIMDQMSQDNQQYKQRDWEILPVENTGSEWHTHNDGQYLGCISPFDCYANPHLCLQELHLNREEDTQHFGQIEQRWLGDNGDEESPEQDVEDTDMQQEPQEGQEVQGDYPMQDYVDHHVMEQDDDFEPFPPAINEDWVDHDQFFDQDEYQRHPSCFGQDVYHLDYYGDKQEQMEFLGAGNVRTYAQPTNAEMKDFWKPQLY